MTSIDRITSELPSGTVAVVGVPFDAQSSFLRGAAEAPARIREVLHNGSSNLCTETGLSLEKHAGWCDAGDLSLSEESSALWEIENGARKILERDVRILALGGDHSITYPLVRAHARTQPALNLLHLDAHPDLYDEMEGNKLSHACPFARIMEEQLVRRLVQVGIRTMTPHQREQADRFGVEVIEMRDYREDCKLEFEGPVYLSLDLDVLDPAFAPGVSHHEPGGFTTREVLHLFHRFKGVVIGADLVEFNPRRDPVGITAMLAAKLLKEMLGKML